VSGHWGRPPIRRSARFSVWFLAWFIPWLLLGGIALVGGWFPNVGSGSEPLTYRLLDYLVGTTILALALGFICWLLARLWLALTHRPLRLERPGGASAPFAAPVAFGQPGAGAQPPPPTPAPPATLGQSAASGATPPATAERRFCPRCGTAYEGSVARFCSGCGAPLPTAEAPVAPAAGSAPPPIPIYGPLRPLSTAERTGGAGGGPPLPHTIPPTGKRQANRGLQVLGIGVIALIGLVWGWQSMSSFNESGRSPTSPPPAAVSTPPAAVAAGTPLPLQAGWVLRENRSEGFALGLPASWEVLDTGQSGFQTSLDGAAKRYPSVSGWIIGRARQVPLEEQLFFAFDGAPESMDSRGITSLSIMRKTFAAPRAFDAELQTYLRQMESADFVIKPVNHSRTQVAGSQAEEIRYKATTKSASGETITLAISHYFWVRDKDVFVINGTTLPDKEGKYAPLFQAVAQSFRWSSGSAAAPPPASPARATPTLAIARAPLPTSPVGGQANDVASLLAQKKIEVRSKGGGLLAIGLSIRRLGAEDLTVLIPVGTYFVSGTAGVQNMVATADRTVVLDDQDWHDLAVPVACANLDRAVPKEADSFTIQTLPQQQDLAKLMAKLQGANLPPEVRQAAVWIVTDNADYDRLGTLVSASDPWTNFLFFLAERGIRLAGVAEPRLIKENEATAAMLVVDQAGIDITKKAIWRQKDVILPGLADGDLKRWLQQR
jgi:hypothetical protein